MKKFIYVLVVIVLVVLAAKYFKGGDQPTNETGATVSRVALKSVSNAATPLLASAKTIVWETNDYPSDVGVNINLLKKTSDSPRAFEFVKTIFIDTPNDGEETWTPAKGEDANNMYVEVTCSSAFTFTQGCQVSGEPMKVSQ